ncbi:MAG: hypothetical protein ACLPX5_11325 [Dissulfurispiraceae bacterium]
MQAESEKNNAISGAIKYKGRLAELSIGITASQLIVFLFDYLLYPFVIYNFGILMGGVVMTVLSLIACLLAIKFYDWSKRDWLGIEAIKEISGYMGTNKSRRVTSWLLKKSEPVAFLFLSVKFDPFVTTAYMRHGKFNGMSRRDWSIFMGSLLFSNAYWTLACYMGITLFEWTWKTVKVVL